MLKKSEILLYVSFLSFSLLAGFQNCSELPSSQNVTTQPGAIEINTKDFHLSQITQSLTKSSVEIELPQWDAAPDQKILMQVSPSYENNRVAFLEEFF